jgi:hypothetical protein
MQGSLTSNTYPEPYADWTGFQPVNAPYGSPEDLVKWQPLIETDGRGSIMAQTHITPQAGQVAPVLADQSYFLDTQSNAPYNTAQVSKLV